MELLLDTHALIWYGTAHPNLSSTALSHIKSADKVFISTVSLWEMTLLVEKGKIPIEERIADFSKKLTEKGSEIITLKTYDFEKVITLPKIHRDPFDRILIAQALNRDLSLLTKDSQIQKYPLETLW